MSAESLKGKSSGGTNVFTHKGSNRLIVATAMNRDDGGCGGEVVVD